MSSAFSWKPYGVSSRTAGRPSSTRAKISRCGFTMVGAVSPEPMITSNPAVTIVTSSLGGGQRQQVGRQLGRVLGVEVVVGARIAANPGNRELTGDGGHVLVPGGDQEHRH